VWDPTKYMNIFVVNFIYPEGLALPEGALIGGMSPFPPDNPLSQALTGGDTDIDGVLIRHDCIGGIGTAESRHAFKYGKSLFYSRIWPLFQFISYFSKFDIRTYTY